MDWSGVLWFAGLIFMAWIAVVGLLFSGVAEWQRRHAPVPDVLDRRDNYTSRSIWFLGIATTGAGAAIALFCSFERETSIRQISLSSAEILSIAALFASIGLAIKGRGIARKTLLRGQVVLAIGGVGSFFLAWYFATHLTIFH
jgi:hypothetical protein